MIPALSENKPLRLTTVTAMYVFQGIQMGLMLVSIPAFLASNDIPAAKIGGFIGIIMLPWSLKLLAAPVMDRFTFLVMGRRRPWVIAGLVGASLGYISMALVPDPLNNMALLNITALVASIFTAISDVAIDGMAVDIIPIEEQSVANSFMWGGKVIGAAGTAAGAAYLLSNHGMMTTFTVAAIFSILFCVIPILFLERPGEKRLPWSKGQISEEALKIQAKGWKEIFVNVIKVLFLPSSLLIIAITFFHGITYGLFDALMPVITVQDLGWSDTEYSNLAALAGLIAGIAGMVLGGIFIKKVGRKKSLGITLSVLVILGAIMPFLEYLWSEGVIIRAFVIIVIVIRTLIMISILTSCMLLCWKKVAATQFSIYMAVGNLGVSAGAALLGPFESFLTHAQITFAFSTVALLAIILIRWINFSSHLEAVRSLEKS